MSNRKVCISLIPSVAIRKFRGRDTVSPLNSLSPMMWTVRARGDKEIVMDSNYHPYKGYDEAHCVRFRSNVTLTFLKKGPRSLEMLSNSVNQNQSINRRTSYRMRPRKLHPRTAQGLKADRLRQ